MTKGRKVSKGTRPRWVAEEQGLHPCICGCGQQVTLRPEHYPNAPRFIHGHNMTGARRREWAEPLPCECGCGELATPEKRFVYTHNLRGRKLSSETRLRMSEGKRGELNPMFGKHSPNFKGRIYHGDGYILIWIPEHPFASNGRVLEHRLIAEQHLRETHPDSPHLVRLGDQLYLRPRVDVHHRDEVKDNNSVDNLLVLTRADHARLHYLERSNLTGQDNG